MNRIRKPKSKYLKTLAVLAAMAVLASVIGANAYLSASDSGVNTFTIGEVTADLTEPSWETVDPDNLVPGQELRKDPTVENTGINSFFTFIKVSVPKMNIYTYNPDPNQNPADPGQRARNPKAVTDLFILPAPNTGWTLIKTDATKADKTDYVYAYGSSSALTKVEKGEKTAKPVFDKVQYCYAVEGQGLDKSTLKIDVKAYAIQSEDIAGTGTNDPKEVWTILTNQVGQ